MNTVNPRVTPKRTHVGQEIVLSGSRPSEGSRKYLVRQDASLVRAIPKVNMRQAKRERAKARKSA